MENEAVLLPFKSTLFGRLSPLLIAYGIPLLIILDICIILLGPAFLLFLKIFKIEYPNYLTCFKINILSLLSHSMLWVVGFLLLWWRAFNLFTCYFFIPLAIQTFFLMLYSKRYLNIKWQRAILPSLFTSAVYLLLIYLAYEMYYAPTG